MDEERLHSLALFSSEAQFMTDCDIEDIIEDFEKQKSRRKPVEPYTKLISLTDIVINVCKIHKQYSELDLLFCCKSSIKY